MAIRFSSQSERYREFSNFSAFPVDFDGLHWPTTEHYYQAQKFTDPDLKTMIRNAPQPLAAKTLADQYRDRMRPDWQAVKDEVMYRAVRRKFELHAPLRALLLSTGDEDIMEAAPHDNYWGSGPDGAGENRLGRIMERIRAELQAAAAAVRDNAHKTGR